MCVHCLTYQKLWDYGWKISWVHKSEEAWLWHTGWSSLLHTERLHSRGSHWSIQAQICHHWYRSTCPEVHGGQTRYVLCWGHPSTEEPSWNQDIAIHCTGFLSSHTKGTCQVYMYTFFSSKKNIIATLKCMIVPAEQWKGDSYKEFDASLIQQLIPTTWKIAPASME